MADLYTNKIMNMMLRHSKNDVRRINHTLKVFALAQTIARAEDCDERMRETVEYAAILHDIGIFRSEQLHGAGNLDSHADIGEQVARELLDGLEIDSAVKERVYFLVGHHHAYKNISGLDLQILIEADLIVTMFEDDYSRDLIQAVRKNTFRTKTGRGFLDSMYLSSGPPPMSSE
jgi:HD superfamily phosphodiesterase